MLPSDFQPGFGGCGCRLPSSSTGSPCTRRGWDQVELVFSAVQRKVLTPNHFRNRDELQAILLTHFDERSKHPVPIRWSYTSATLRKQFATRSRPRALSGA